MVGHGGDIVFSLHTPQEIGKMGYTSSTITPNLTIFGGWICFVGGKDISTNDSYIVCNDIISDERYVVEKNARRRRAIFFLAFFI